MTLTISVTVEFWIINFKFYTYIECIVLGCIKKSSREVNTSTYSLVLIYYNYVFMPEGVNREVSNCCQV